MKRRGLRKSPEYSDISIRYEQESDYVQIYNGVQWINWMQAGLQFLNFLKLAENQWDIIDGTASHTFSVSNGKLSLIAIPKTAGESVIANCTFPVDLSTKSRITIKGRVYLYTTAQAVISIGSYRYTTPQAPSKWVDISTIGDLSALSGKAELAITIPCYEGYPASQIQLTTLLIE